MLVKNLIRNFAQVSFSSNQLAIASSPANPRPTSPNSTRSPTLASSTNRPARATRLDERPVTIYNFIFTTCTGICPLMNQQHARAHAERSKKNAPARFVSITVGPLASYAAQPQRPRWTFLTGDRQNVVDLSLKGVKLAAGDPMPGGGVAAQRQICGCG